MLIVSWLKYSGVLLYFTQLRGRSTVRKDGDFAVIAMRRSRSTAKLRMEFLVVTMLSFIEKERSPPYCCPVLLYPPLKEDLERTRPVPESRPLEKDWYTNSYLVFIKLAAFEFFFTFILEGDNNETDKDVDHEESDDNDVENKVDSHVRTVVLCRPFVRLCRVHRVF